MMSQKMADLQVCQLSLYRSESQDFTTDLKFSLLCCKYSLHVHLAVLVLCIHQNLESKF